MAVKISSHDCSSARTSEGDEKRHDKVLQNEICTVQNPFQNEKEIWAETPSKAAIILRHTALERNKRCLLAYLNNRAERIRAMRWQFGAVLPPDIKSNLCEAEQNFFAKYNRDLATYMRSVGDGTGVDLMTDNQPPKSLYIEVRCIQDYGEMETDDGSIVFLKKNTQHYLPRQHCEQLIKQGILEHII